MNENSNSKAYGPRAIVSFRPAEPVSQMIKLETARRQQSRPSRQYTATATRVIADAVAEMLGRRYPALADEWKKLKN
jgi:hypothetical protein